MTQKGVDDLRSALEITDWDVLCEHGDILTVWWTVLLNTLTFVLTQPFPLLRYDASLTINPGLPETWRLC